MNFGDDSSGADAEVETVNPWEERKDRGRAAAFISALALLARSPRGFFGATRVDAGWWGPLLFAGLAGTLAALLNGLILFGLALALPDAALDLMSRMELSGEPDWGSGLDQAPFLRQLVPFVGLQLLLLFLPVVFVFAPLGPLVAAGLAHLLLIVTRSPRPHGFRGTWVAAGYAAGAFLLGAVPIAGDLLSTLGTAALFATGLHAIQGIRPLRAALVAAVLPLLVLVATLLQLLLAAPAA